MNVYRRIEEFQANTNNILTIGTFDGVHRGHKYLLKHVVALSNNLTGVPAVVTFEPHPQMVINNGHRKRIKILTTLEEKLTLLEQAGIHTVYVIPFNSAFAQLSSMQFIETFLREKIGLKGIIVGYDHGFGNARQGNAGTLSSAFQDGNIYIEQLDQFTVHDQKLSSSVIRKKIDEGEIVSANELLGYAYNITGEVILGDKRGRELGFPTANLDILNSNKVLPANGVYAVNVELENTLHHGMANLGVRPTFLKNSKSLEINLFDFSDEIYGKVMRVYFLKKIRNEKKFATVDGLISQLNSDKTETELFLKSQYTV